MEAEALFRLQGLGFNGKENGNYSLGVKVWGYDPQYWRIKWTKWYWE